MAPLPVYSFDVFYSTTSGSICPGFYFVFPCIFQIYLEEYAFLPVKEANFIQYYSTKPLPMISMRADEADRSGHARLQMR